MTNSNVPSTWYKYDFPLKEVENAPKPSQANYNPKNCAWLIEMFAEIIGNSHTQIVLHYENNTPNNAKDDIYVAHPNDKLYLPDKRNPRLNPKSDELIEYEEKAKDSERLKLFQDNSPAGIEYFK